MKTFLIAMFIAVIGVFPLAAQAPSDNLLPAAEQGITETSAVSVGTSAKEVLPKTTSNVKYSKKITKAQTFNHLHVFSLGGFLVLFFFLVALICGGTEWVFVWFIVLSYFGCFTLPESFALPNSFTWFASTQALHLAIFLGVLLLIHGFLSHFIPFGLPNVSDFAFTLIMLWFMINGVFVDTHILGRIFLIFFIISFSTGGQIGLKFSSKLIPFSEIILPIVTFCCMAMVSIWL